MRRPLKIILVVLVSLVLLYTVVGFFVIPWAIKTQLPPQLQEQLQRQVSIQDAKFNPFLLTLQVEHFDILEEDGKPIVGFDELFVDFELASLIRQVYTFSEIRLVLPYGLVEVRPDSSMNIVDLMEDLDSEETEPDSGPIEEEKPQGLPQVAIDKLSIQQGLVEFRDFSHRNPFVAHMVPINLDLENFSTRPGEANPYKLSAEFDDGESLKWEGSLTLEPVSSEGTLALDGIRLDHFWDYLEDLFRFEISQGTLSVQGRYRMKNTERGFDTQIQEGNVTLQDLAIRELGAEDPVISIPSLAVEDISIDVPKKRVMIPKVDIQDPRFIGWIDADGVMNYQTLFAPIKGESREKIVSVETAEPPPSKEEPWVVNVQTFNLRNFSVGFEDQQPAFPVKIAIDSGNFHTSGISTTLESPLPVDLTFVLNGKGNVQAKGSLNIEPLDIHLALTLKDIGLKPFQPYLSPFVRFDVQEGAVNLEGKTRFQTGSSAQPQVAYAGSVNLSRLVLTDPTVSKPFMKWDALSLQHLDVKVTPTSVQAKKIVLRNPSIHLALNADGEMNLGRLFSPPGQSSKDKEEKVQASSKGSQGAPGPPIKIDTILLDKLHAQFADRSISPSVTTRIEELSGTIRGLSSQQIAKADVDLAGKIDRYSPFTIKGKINPLSKDAYTDLHLTFKNLNLTTVSPYSGKFAGYPINKGKLFLDLDYKVAEHVLVGENKVLVDQIAMGAATDSPDAPSLPIPLALALLKDRKGQIHIDLPIRGNLDDPEFSYWGLIFQALGNLLTKVAASPFNMVGGLVGSLVEGGEEALQYVEFSPGVEDIPATEQEKLSALAKALNDRPGLRLEVTGAADPQLDGKAIAEKELRVLMQKAKFLNPTPSSESPPASVDQIELTEEEEKTYLTKFYTEKFGPPISSPTNGSVENDGSQKKGEPLTAEAMKRRLLEDRAVGKEELRTLAKERAHQIREFLVQEGSISGDRVFLPEVNLTPITENEAIQSPLSLGAN